MIYRMTDTFPILIRRVMPIRQDRLKNISRGWRYHTWSNEYFALRTWRCSKSIRTEEAFIKALYQNFGAGTWVGLGWKLKKYFYRDQGVRYKTFFIPLTKTLFAVEIFVVDDQPMGIFEHNVTRFEAGDELRDD